MRNENNVSRLSKKVAGLFSMYTLSSLPQKSDVRKKRHRQEVVKEVSREYSLRTGCYVTEADIDWLRNEVISFRCFSDRLT